MTGRSASQSIVLLSLLAHMASSTTEWWGDLRASLNPPRAPAFYDVTYDDSECSSGLRADAIPDYVYFGTMIATFTVEEHDDCLRRCVDKPKCKSVNFFSPLEHSEKAFCELLSETQHDNPRLMRPFRRAIHYEKIRCRDGAEDVVDGTHAKAQTEVKPATLPTTTVAPVTPTTTVAASSTTAAVASSSASPRPTVSPPGDSHRVLTGLPRPAMGKAEIPILLKKLAAKNTEFHLKHFSSFRA